MSMMPPPIAANPRQERTTTAAAQTPSQHGNQAGDHNEDRLSGTGVELTDEQMTALQEVRAELQDLESALDSVRKGEAAVKTYADYIIKTMSDIGGLMPVVGGTGDALRNIQNCWEQLQINPLLADPKANYSAQEQMHLLAMISSQIKRMVFMIGYLTIPTRLQEWLNKENPGYYLPFHLVFEDEMPNKEDRVRLLNYLKYQPTIFTGGIVDAANGLIYRYEESGLKRALTLIVLVLFFALFTALVAAACFLRLPGWPITPGHLYGLMVGWGAVLAGVVTHIGVSGVKRAQEQGGLPPIIAVGDFSLIINAKAGQILFKLLLALIGFFGLLFAAGVNNVTPLNSFLIGYSLDSFIELFGSSIEQRASAQAAALKKQMGVAD